MSWGFYPRNYLAKKKKKSFNVYFLHYTSIFFFGKQYSTTSIKFSKISQDKIPNGVRLFPFLSFLKFYFEIFKRLKGALNLPNLILLLFFSFINASYSLSFFCYFCLVFGQYHFLILFIFSFNFKFYKCSNQKYKIRTKCCYNFISTAI